MYRFTPFADGMRGATLYPAFKTNMCAKMYPTRLPRIQGHQPQATTSQYAILVSMYSQRFGKFYIRLEV